MPGLDLGLGLVLDLVLDLGLGLGLVLGLDGPPFGCVRGRLAVQRTMTPPRFVMSAVRRVCVRRLFSRHLFSVGGRRLFSVGV